MPHLLIHEAEHERSGLLQVRWDLMKTLAEQFRIM